ncbi:AAA family ATPase [Campylobacter insulaenigrae]|uniref:AAA family ATPase n=1 Tax=Campylobacter insulaenigrae TaxID=260714 RepID=UPI0021524534|nr:AAA family ATPase [Campylobacter insulaenigrae]MCR6575440.1 AAA family ATPase [Campylobacter insulaenigrae]
MIKFSNEDREKFIKAIDELVKQVDDCILRDKRTQRGDVSNKDSFSQNIKQNLSFISDKYNYSFKIAIGNSNGFLSNDCWIMFVRNDLLKENLINGKKITPTKGVYLFIAYSGYFQNNKYLVLQFGFPQGDIENSRCVAVNKMESEGYLQKFDFIYDLDDKDKLVKDFLEMMNYFSSLDENDFKLYEAKETQKEHLKTKVENFNTKEILKQNKENQNPPLNQILYGPPGTGKTYHTIDKALEILGENLTSKDEKKAKFDEYIKNGQIVFTTFHQSYGYEEFVEGIKPEFDEKELKYKVRPGIFKKICNEALDKEIKIATNEDIYIDRNSKVWKISLGVNASLRDKCFKENKICIGWNDIPKNKDERFLNLGSNDKNSIISFVEYMQIGDLVCVFNTSETIKGVGIITSDVKYNEDKEYQTYREVSWISQNDEINILDLNNDKILVQKTVYELYRISPNDLLAKISQPNNLEDVEDNTKKNFIIIIDEINRGNVSKIFGELITLIEPSKRIGAKEELKVILPYSAKEFGVPKNVYIIGTMNTADRSITSLDTALRRRFEFVEMMPNPNVLSDNCKGVNLQELLKAINTRIEYLLDREKTIGHAFFIGIENLENLKKVFQNKIIPLLQEYFYNDYALINAVLNDNGMIFEDKKDDTYLQKIKNLHNVDSERNIYTITPFNDEIWDDIKTYQVIYNDTIKNDKQ